MVVRRPAVANQFYPGDPHRLHYEVGRLMGDITGDEKAIAVVSPHAGYIYSGHVAGAVFARIRVPQRCIVLGPNHTGFGADVAVMADGVWEMPFGPVPIASDLAAQILTHCSVAENDIDAHIYEHSIEVQIPFLQYRQKGLEIVPICLSRLSYEDCTYLGLTLAKVIEKHPEDILIVASTDMTHYESQAQAEEKDSLAIERIKALDPEGLYNTVLTHKITMCGYIPTVVTLIAALALGATQAELVKYATSGDITGDYRQVVGYSGIVIK